MTRYDCKQCDFSSSTQLMLDRHVEDCHASQSGQIIGECNFPSCDCEESEECPDKPGSQPLPLPVGTYKDKFGDIRWVGTGDKTSPEPPVERPELPALIENRDRRADGTLIRFYDTESVNAFREAAQSRITQLTGEPFSDRSHAALKSRAQVAEAKLAKIDTITSTPEAGGFAVMKIREVLEGK